MACPKACVLRQAQLPAQRPSIAQGGIPPLVPSVATLQQAFGLCASQRYRSAAIILRQTCRAARGATAELSNSSPAAMDLEASALQSGIEQPSAKASAQHPKQGTDSRPVLSADGVATASRQGSDRLAKRHPVGMQPPAKVSRSTLVSPGSALTSDAIARALGRQQEVWVPVQG